MHPVTKLYIHRRKLANPSGRNEKVEMKNNTYTEGTAHSPSHSQTLHLSGITSCSGDVCAAGEQYIIVPPGCSVVYASLTRETVPLTLSPESYKARRLNYFGTTRFDRNTRGQLALVCAAHEEED